MFYIVYCTLPNGKEDVVVIPQNWLNEDGTCVWPPVTVKSDVANKLAAKSRPPDDIWPVYPARVVRAYGTYDEARLKLPLAEMTSDLSDTEDKRVPVKRGFFDDTIEITQPVTKSRKSCLPLAVLPTPPSQFDIHVADEHANTGVIPSGTFDASSFTFCLKEFASIETQTDNPSKVETELIPELLKENIAVKAELGEIRKQLEWVIEMMKKTPNESVTSREVIITVPYDDKQSLLDFDSRISAELELKTKLTEEFWSLGGKSVGGAISRMMDKILTNRLGCSFSLLGRGGNESFKALNIFNVMLDALRRHKWIKGVTCDNLEAGINSWLRHCKSKVQKMSTSEPVPVGTNEDELG